MFVIPSHVDWLKDADSTSGTLLPVLQHNSTCRCVCRPLSEDRSHWQRQNEASWVVQTYVVWRGASGTEARRGCSTVKKRKINPLQNVNRLNTGQYKMTLVIPHTDFLERSKYSYSHKTALLCFLPCFSRSRRCSFLPRLCFKALPCGREAAAGLIQNFHLVTTFLMSALSQKPTTVQTNLNFWTEAYWKLTLFLLCSLLSQASPTPSLPPLITVASFIRQIQLQETYWSKSRSLPGRLAVDWCVPTSAYAKLGLRHL